MFEEVQRHLEANRQKVSTGTIMDATIINSPSLNADTACDPDLHQTKKGNQWYFALKTDVGVDSRTKIMHAVAATAPNMVDLQVQPDLLHGTQTRARGEQSYRGQSRVVKLHAPDAEGLTHCRCRHRGVVDVPKWINNRSKFKVRVKVESAIGVVKRVFGCGKV